MGRGTTHGSHNVVFTSSYDIIDLGCEPGFGESGSEIVAFITQSAGGCDSDNCGNVTPGFSWNCPVFDFMMAQLVLLPFIVAMAISLAVTMLTIVVYRGLGLVDKSTKRDHPKHIHTQPVPRGGGIPILIAMVFATLMFVKLDTQMVGILLGGLILAIAGILDDLLDISPYIRLALGLLAAIVVVMSGIGITFVSNPFGEGVLQFDVKLIANGLTVLWIMWGMNFVNMGAKGLDGQLPGVTLIAAVVIGILSFRFANDITAWPSTYLSFALAGAYAGFLVFNVYPQKIMPGWGGGALAGYFLAVLSILSGAKVATAMIVLGVPLMDVVYVILRRLAAGKSPVWGDTNHLHHQLLRLGWSKAQIAGLYWLMSAVLGAVALQLNSQMKIYTILLIAIAVGGVLLWINLFLSSNQSE
ncbi:MAG: Glycosyl transferase, family 4, conserved region-containing protein [Microgenomates group bacterium GW2011_GWA2_46_16]|nr:MAG: Glycosyl transferase, family 4, conserved region-containing protein [Microgenomates group bacterium GW2011_GWA2_46_16]